MILKFALIILVFALSMSMMCIAVFAPPMLNEAGKNINGIFMLPAGFLCLFGCYLISEFFDNPGK